MAGLMRTGSRHPRDERRGAREVHDVVHVVAVARTLLIPHAGDGAVEAVAEPVHGQGHHEQPCAPRRGVDRGERRSSRHHRHKRQRGQMRPTSRRPASERRYG